MMRVRLKHEPYKIVTIDDAELADIEAHGFLLEIVREKTVKPSVDSTEASRDDKSKEK